MLKVFLDLWPVFSALVIFLFWLAGLEFRLQSLKTSRYRCEERCNARINDLKDEYGEDMKEIKADLKDSIKTIQNMNVTLASLAAYLQGKGVTHPAMFSGTGEKNV